MDERDLRLAALCGLCHQKVGASGLPLFYRVTVTRYGVDLNAVRRQAGLEMMLGGNVAIAQALSPEGEMTVTLQEPATITVCETCAADEHSVHVLAEAAGRALDANAAPR